MISDVSLLETAVLQRATGTVETQLDDTRVLLNADLEYLGLDAVAQQIWDLLATPASLDQLVDQLTTTYDISPEECRRDVLRFLEDMQAHGLVECR